MALETIDRWWKREPEHIAEEYRFGDPVTRENVLRMLLQSFRFSKGDPNLQSAYFVLLIENFRVLSYDALEGLGAHGNLKDIGTIKFSDEEMRIVDDILSSDGFRTNKEHNEEQKPGEDDGINAPVLPYVFVDFIQSLNDPIQCTLGYRADTLSDYNGSEALSSVEAVLKFFKTSCKNY